MWGQDKIFLSLDTSLGLLPTGKRMHIKVTYTYIFFSFFEGVMVVFSSCYATLVSFLFFPFLLVTNFSHFRIPLFLSRRPSFLFHIQNWCHQGKHLNLLTPHSRLPYKSIISYLLYIKGRETPSCSKLILPHVSILISPKPLGLCFSGLPCSIFHFPLLLL